jgi:basic membrane protein A
MKNLASKNKLVLIAGGQYADIAKTAAAAYPRTKFVVMDGSPSDKTRPKNLSAYLVAEWQPAYVTGAIAAKLTKTKTIGYLGGLDIPTTANTGKGYEAGAKSIGGVKVLSTNIGSFDDVAKAKEAAAAQIAGGADVLFTFLDAANPGVYSAIADSGKPVKVIVGVRIKSICADSKYAAGWTLANYGKRVQIAAADFKKGNGTLPAVKILDMKIPNMEELNLCRGTSTPALVKLQGTIKKNILNGKIKNPL